MAWLSRVLYKLSSKSNFETLVSFCKDRVGTFLKLLWLRSSFFTSIPARVLSSIFIIELWEKSRSSILLNNENVPSEKWLWIKQWIRQTICINFGRENNFWHRFRMQYGQLLAWKYKFFIYVLPWQWISSVVWLSVLLLISFIFSYGNKAIHMWYL